MERQQNFAFALGVADEVRILYKRGAVVEEVPDELERNKEIQGLYLAI